MDDIEKQSEVQDNYPNSPPSPLPRTVRFQNRTDHARSTSRPYANSVKSQSPLGTSRGRHEYRFDPQFQSHGLSSTYNSSLYDGRFYPPVAYSASPYYQPPAPPLPDQPVFETKSHHDVAPAATSYQNADEYELASNASRDEHSAVHHMIKINFPQSSDEIDDEITDLKARKRAFTDQPSFAYKNEVEKWDYDIVQTQLQTASNDSDHELALLKYEENFSNANTAQIKPETRWIHFQTDSMSLELFKMEVLRLNLVPDDTAALLMALFKRLKQHHEGSSVHGKHLEPTALDFVGEGEDGKTKKCSVAFVAFPYLMLDLPHLRNDSLSSSSIHPVKSLFQFHYLFDSTEMRDEDQIVRFSREAEEILHVPQIWMLWTSEDIIFSMASTDISSLQRDYIAFEKVHHPASIVAQPQIRIIDFEGKQYYLPLPQCDTWFGLMALLIGVLDPESAMHQSFLNDTWKDIYELHLDDELVSETNWLNLLKSREKSNSISIHIVLKPPVALKGYQTPLRHKMSQDLHPPRREYLPDPGSLISHSNPYRDLSMFSQRPTGNRIAKIRSSLNASLLQNGSPERNDYLTAVYFPTIPQMNGATAGDGWSPMLEPPHCDTSSKSPGRVRHDGQPRFSRSTRSSFTPLNPTDCLPSRTHASQSNLSSSTCTDSTEESQLQPTSVDPGPDCYNQSLSSSSAEQISTQIVIPGPKAKDERYLYEATQESVSTASAVAHDNRPSQRSLYVSDSLSEMDSDQSAPNIEPLPGSSRSDSSVSLAYSVSAVEISSVKDDSIDPPGVSRRSTVDFQSYVEDADDDDLISLIEEPPISTSQAQRHPSVKELKLDDPGIQNEEHSEMGIGRDEGPANDSDSSIGCRLSPVTDLSENVRIDEANFEIASPSNAASSIDLSQDNEVEHENESLAVPGTLSVSDSLAPRVDEKHVRTMNDSTALPVFDYLVPRFDDEPVKVMNESTDSTGKMNPFAYQVYNDAWESTDHVSSTADRLETSPFCPIFAWKPEAIDGITQYNTEPNALVPRQWKDMDRIIHAILQERDADAKSFLFGNSLENNLVSDLAESSRSEVFNQMGSVESKMTELKELNTQEGVRFDWLTKKAVIANAIGILDSFLPLHYQKLEQYWITGKFWGAILRIVVNEFPNSYLNNVASDLSHFHKCIRQIHNGVLYGKRKESSIYYLPKALVNVFNPLVFYLCICSRLNRTDCPEWIALQVRAVSINESLLTGRHQLISMIHAGDFTGAKVFRRVDSQAIITFILGGLIKPSSRACSAESSDEQFDLLQTYRQYLSDLRHEVRREPRAETFDRIQQMREELSIVSIILDQQMKVLKQMRLVWSNVQGPANQISTHSIYQSRRQIKQFQRDLGELEHLAGKTSVLLRSSIEVRKESNSQAIVVFTIVTVIFLPLSFITSYFGMNSVDIRDGTFDQSLFWIVALPTTTFLLLVLWTLIGLRRRMRVSGKRFGSGLQSARGLRRLCKLPLQKIAFSFNATMDALSKNQASRRESMQTIL